MVRRHNSHRKIQNRERVTDRHKIKIVEKNKFQMSVGDGFEVIEHHVMPLMHRAEAFHNFLGFCLRGLQERSFNPKSLVDLPVFRLINLDKLALQQSPRASPQQSPQHQQRHPPRNLLHSVMRQSCALPPLMDAILEDFAAKFQRRHEETVQRMKALRDVFPGIKKQMIPLRHMTKKVDEHFHKVRLAGAALDRKPDSHKKLQAKLQAEREAYEALQDLDNLRDSLTTDLKNFLAKEYEEASAFADVLDLQRRCLEEATKALTETVDRAGAALLESGRRPVFGTPLEVHLGDSGRRIAAPLEECCAVMSRVGLGTEGLLRIPGSAVRIKLIVASLDSGDVDWERVAKDIHSVAGAMKQYLRDLPEPLLTFALDEEFLAVGRGLLRADDEERDLQRLVETIRRLPKTNFENLAFLVDFLARVDRKSETNKMKAACLAIVMSPNLSRSPSRSADVSDVAEFPIRNRLVETLISRRDRLFPSLPAFSPTSSFHPPALVAPRPDGSSLPEEDRIRAALNEALAERDRILARKGRCRRPTDYEEQRAAAKATPPSPRTQQRLAGVNAELRRLERVGSLNSRMRRSSGVAGAEEEIDGVDGADCGVDREIGGARIARSLSVGAKALERNGGAAGVGRLEFMGSMMKRAASFESTLVDGVVGEEEEEEEEEERKVKR